MKFLLSALTLTTLAALAIAEEPCQCQNNFDPVCATDSTWYANLCTLQCDREKELATDKFYNFETGKCENPCMCPADWRPVCATDNSMFSNLCSLKCSGEKTLDESKVYNEETQQCENVQ